MQSSELQWSTNLHQLQSAAVKHSHLLVLVEAVPMPWQPAAPYQAGAANNPQPRLPALPGAFAGDLK